jgi:hypothetical protein
MNGIPIRVTLALASIGAAVIHFLVTPDHFEEFVLFGVFFLGLGIFQAVWAGGVLVKPNVLVVAAGVLVSALVIGVWTLSRTTGLPIGPEAGEPEAVGLSDVLATALEGLIVLGGTYLLLGQRTSEQPAPETVREQERRAA